MGNTSGLADDTKEVILSLHSVHNVQHLPNESYYGMATDHTSNTEVPVTSERPARLTAGLSSVLSTRIYLHERGAPSSADRPVGQLSIPIQEMLDLCGPGIYQTWFFLEPPSDYGTVQPNQTGWKSRVSDKFKHALYGVSQQLHAPRVCLTLLEANTDPAEWTRSEKDRLAFFDPVLVSHAEHLQITHAYFDEIEHAEDESRGRGRPSAPSEAELAEIAELQAELDTITDEANRRIETGNESILKLKSQLKQLRDVELTQLQREHREAEKRLGQMRARSAEMQALVNDERSAAVDEELEKLKKDIIVLTNQKAALMKMVQDIYGSAQQPEDSAAGSVRSLVHDAAARALADIRVCTNTPEADDEPADAGGECNLLPDPTEFLGAEPLKPL